MDIKKWVLLLCSLCCLSFHFFFTLQEASGFEIESEVRLKMAIEWSAGYLIYFSGPPDLSGASALEWKERGEFVAGSLQVAATASQARVKEYLDTHNVKYRSFWAANVIVVEASNEVVLNGLGQFSEIEAIRARVVVPAPGPTPGEAGAKSAKMAGIEPNLTHVNVDKVWALGYDGAGMTIGILDSGVRYTHKSLVGQYRGNLGNSFDHNYNWWDPSNACNGTPCPATTHGTHVAGIALGDDGAGNRIGMAPGAKWIACVGCVPGNCPDENLLSCGQFMLAPTDLQGNNPDPTRRPHLVNNSWGGGPNTKWYWAVIANWRAAGIYPVFANGNNGPGCSTLGSPEDYPIVTSVGNVYYTTDQPSDRSTRGPSTLENNVNPMGYPYLKPLISAPGMDIRSAYSTGDGDYTTMSGTSMASPHVAGLVALMLQAAPCLTQTQIEKVLAQTATPIAYATTCGNSGPENVPNNATGWGIIDAYKAVNSVLGVCGGMGALQGSVTSGSSRVEGAVIRTDSRLTATTDSSGRYSIPHLPAGAQALTITADGYYGTTATAVISANATTTVNIALKAKPFVTVTGKVADGSGAGWPLGAPVTAASSNSTTTVLTNPTTGRYSLSLRGDTSYTFTVTSRGYETETRTVTVSGTTKVQDFSLRTDRTCSAQGYAENRLLYEEFEGIFPPAGWNRSASGSTPNVWRRNDYYGTKNRTNGSGFCAQAGNDRDKWDAFLMSPTVALPASGGATLFFENLFWSSLGYFEAWVDLTDDGGITWHNLADWSNNRGPVREQLDLSGYAGKSVQVRWRYSTNNRWGDSQQQIDNVQITGACQVKAKVGSLIRGKVLDANTGLPVAGIKVANDLGETATSDGSGLFTLFSTSGRRTFIANPTAKSYYGSLVVRATIPSGAKTILTDFRLPAGKVSSNAPGLSVALAANSTAVKALTLVNKGGVAASVRLIQTDPGTGEPAKWLSLSPQTGSVPVRGSLKVMATFNSSGLQPGTHTAQITVVTSTPYPSLVLPVTLVVKARKR
jgi:subtilisin family serine protease